jgi:hypothetical protein
MNKTRMAERLVEAQLELDRTGEALALVVRHAPWQALAEWKRLRVAFPGQAAAIRLAVQRASRVQRTRDQIQGRRAGVSLAEYRSRHGASSVNARPTRRT